ncbi:MAG: SPFH domain-containing protein [Verrucomicrobia bacterium]|nr:SPFH domain-containing protein [Verrucomicrobiota bacterium]
MKHIVRIVILVVAVAAVGELIWQWGFCRFYVRPGYMAVVTAKQGDALPPDQILAREGLMGIQENVLGEGRHFLNPIFNDFEIRPAILIPPGKVGLVTSKVGANLPVGEFLAEPGQKGSWRRVLGPGRYRINPYGYQVDIVSAISIPVGYAGVITSLSGAQAAEGEFAEPNQKGVRREILQPGLYYVNPREYQVDVLEIGVNQVSLIGKQGGTVITKSNIAPQQNAAIAALQSEVLDEQRHKRYDYMKKSANLFTSSRSGAPATSPVATSQYKPMTPEEQERQMLESGQAKVFGDSMATLGVAQFVEFPSRDGFQINLDMTVEFELAPDKIAWLFRTYGDLPAVVDKILLPQISSVSRNKGSEYRAKDFIVGAGREKFQQDLTLALARTLGLKNITVHNALIRHAEVPQQILEPIQQASLAVEQDLTNKERQNTARKQAQLNTELGMIAQLREQVGQETEKLKAEVRADQEKQMAYIQAEAIKQVAEIRKETAGIQAETLRISSKAEADALRLVQGEEAKGLQLKTAAFGDPQAYALNVFAQNLNPTVRINILHAGDGTLWTDLKTAGLAELGGAEVLKKHPPAK